jgi:SAM-dependent methyltransferase
MNVVEHNRRAWDRQVEGGNTWTRPVSPEVIAAARNGDWSIILTPLIPVPLEWLPDLPGKDVLCLASGGGQQGPVLAAAGAHVTVFDNSPRQLERDRFVADRDGLAIKTVQGDMADLSVFPDGCFDYIVHPVSNVFAQDVRPVWREAFRVLRKGGVLIAGFDNPAVYLFDYDRVRESGKLEVVHSIPYADIDALTDEQRRLFEQEGRPFEFSHTLDDQIGGQLAAGFVLTGFYEDNDEDPDDTPLCKYMPVYMATRAVKP